MNILCIGKAFAKWAANQTVSIMKMKIVFFALTATLVSMIAIGQKSNVLLKAGVNLANVSITDEGNIDDAKARLEFPLHNRFLCENVSVWITHIGGYPGKYNPAIREEMTANPPKLFICGHSHILKVMFDKKNNLLHMNPGAAGKSGFHQMRTMLRFVIDDEKIKDLEIIEIGKK